MQIDNSGPVFVFDEKTTEAIEEGKNRVTLLQVEELRLGKLKKSLESDIIKLEGDIVYKDKVANDLETGIATAQKQLADLSEEVTEAITQRDSLVAELEAKEKAVQEKETQAQEKETVLNMREQLLNEREEALNAKEERVSMDTSAILDKKDKIDAFLKSL